jgi:4-alpha-glucanotransferase
MVRLAMMSVADTAVTPLQDLMNLYNTARMNYPGKVGGYWRWRYTPDMLKESIAYRLQEYALLYGRLPETEADS